MMEVARKAGMEGVDLDETNRFIHDMSVGTRFYKNQQKKDAILQHRVDNLQKRFKKYKLAAENEINYSQRHLELDRHMATLESTRDLSRTWLHIDMDAFYAEVELQSRPDLVGKPIAVGSMDMLATSSYEARKFGVRAGIPGFLAVQLCPSLEILPLNFSKYRAVSAVIRTVLADYDPDFQASSLDEATLELTEYLTLRHHTPVAIAIEIRTRILQQTGLTCSMGIAPTNMLAKMCAEQNKPNGYYMLPSNRDSIVQFMSKMPVRKVPGIGKVTEKLLEAVGIKTCRDILEQVHTVFGVFPKFTADFFLQSALGIAQKRVKNIGNLRKSISREKTFRDFYSDAELLQKCQEISADLAEELLAHKLEAKCMTLKLKTIDFEVQNKIFPLERHIHSEEEIYRVASELLKSEMPIELRTLGVKISELQSTSSSPPSPSSSLYDEE